ncbi:F-box/LRR-repeat protein 25 [Linum perenne]
MKRKKKMKMKSNPSPTVDRISELPDEIIHRILQIVDHPKIAVRMSILSRRWLHIWRTYPAIELYDGYYSTIRFQRFADATHKRLRAVPLLLLDSFDISLNPDHRHSQPLCKLLSSASLSPESGCSSSRSPLKVVVKNPDRCMGFVDGGMFLNCGRTKFLQLEGCDLIGLQRYNVCLDNLHELVLDEVRVKEQSFLSCLANAAPRLEKLSLRCIYEIYTIDISASDFPSLKSLSFDGRDRNGMQKLQLSSAPLLEKLYFRGNCMLMKVVSSSSAPNLKSVEVHQVCAFRSRKLEDLISKLPSLESLDFDMGRRLSLPDDDGVRISAHKLRKLTMKNWYWQYELEIDAPNLVTLSIEIDGLPLDLRVVNVASNCRCVFDCSPVIYQVSTFWLIDVRRCLGALATRFRHLVFKLNFWTLEKVLAFDMDRVEYESSPLPVQHLQLGTNLPLGPDDIEKQAAEVHILDGLLWTCHPKTLSIARLRQSSRRTSLFSYISKQIKRRNLLDCCSNGMCWRHQFKDAPVQRCEDNGCRR